MKDNTLADGLRYLVLHIVEELVDHDRDGDIEVTAATSSYCVTIELRTHPDDIGQVVGMRGVVITGLRAILAAAGGKAGSQVNLVYVTERERLAQLGGRR